MLAFAKTNKNDKLCARVIRKGKKMKSRNDIKY